MKLKDENLIKSNALTSKINLQRESGNPTRLPSNYPPPTLKVEGVTEQNLILSCSFNLTVRIKIKEFNRRQASMLIGQSLFKVSKYGLNIVDWLVLEYLYNYLIGSKQSFEELKDPREYCLILLLKSVLSSVDVSELMDKKYLPEDLQTAILNSSFVPNERTFHSRETSYLLSKFLSIRSVPVDSLLERSKNSERYSSYCKGYGEGSSTGRRRKTRPSAELDGEPVSLENLKFHNFSLSNITEMLDLTMLETKYRLLRKKT